MALASVLTEGPITADLVNAIIAALLSSAWLPAQLSVNPTKLSTPEACFSDFRRIPYWAKYLPGGHMEKVHPDATALRQRSTYGHLQVLHSYPTLHVCVAVSLQLG